MFHRFLLKLVLMSKATSPTLAEKMQLSAKQFFSTPLQLSDEEVSHWGLGDLAIGSPHFVTHKSPWKILVLKLQENASFGDDFP